MQNTISIIGCGWLGFPLAKTFVENGYTVKGSTRTPEKLSFLQSAGIAPFLIDLDKPLEEQAIVPFLTSDILIINIPPGRKRPDVVNRHPKEIKVLVKKAMDCGVENIIFISSTGVYSNCNQIVTENDIPQPTSDSGKALVQIENWLKQQSGINSTILRMGGLVGGERKAGRFLAGKQNLKNGNAPVNMIHRKDAIAIIVKIIIDKNWNKMYNCCVDEHPTRAKFYHHQTIKDGFEPPHFLEDSTPDFKIISNEKLKKELGYSFIYRDPMGF